jgi:hypothetical protein
MWMEACPPYCEKEETGKVKDGGIDSVSGPNPSHYIILSIHNIIILLDVWNRQVRTEFIFSYA